MACGVNPDFGLVTSNPATTILSHRMNDGGPNMLFLLNTDARPDALSLDLYNNMGGHGVLNAPGSYALGAADARLETCGLCIAIYTDFDSSTKMFSGAYLALGQGTLTLTKADATGLAGRLQGLKLRHVDLSSNTTKETGDGCSVTVEDVRFDMPYSQ